MAEEKKLPNLKRSNPSSKEPKIKEPASVTAGAIDKVTDLVFNPSRDKMREMTVIDRLQGRLFPQLDMVNQGRRYVMDIAMYRQDPEEFERAHEEDEITEPKAPDMLDDFLYHTAQWQKSIGGQNMKEGVNIVLAETEAKGGDDDWTKMKDPYAEP